LGLGVGDSVEFAGLSLTGFNGLLQAVDGVMTSGSLYVEEYNALVIID